jgi:hypothetical protein
MVRHRYLESRGNDCNITENVKVMRMGKSARKPKKENGKLGRV